MDETTDTIVVDEENEDAVVEENDDDDDADDIDLGESIIIEDEEDEVKNDIDSPLDPDENNAVEEGKEKEDNGPPKPPTFGDWSTGNSDANDSKVKKGNDENAPKPPLKVGLSPKLLPPQQLPSQPKRKPLTVDEDLAEWIQEYLQYRGFTNTLDCFQAEYLSRQYAVTSSQAAHTSSTKEEKSDSTPSNSKESRESVVIRSRLDKLNTMISCFNTGDSEGFIKLWYTHIPLYVRQEDQRVQKCYFMVRVYFLARCWALEGSSISSSSGSRSPRNSPDHSPTKRKKHSSLLAREMRRFREYLEGEGGDIAGTDSTLEKYPAMLYVGNPNKHSSFTECFSGVGPVVKTSYSNDSGNDGGNQWTKNIRNEIRMVVDDTLQHVPAPRLLQM